jgi:hypothetical protein
VEMKSINACERLPRYVLRNFKRGLFVVCLFALIAMFNYVGCSRRHI